MYFKTDAQNQLFVGRLYYGCAKKLSANVTSSDKNGLIAHERNTNFFAQIYKAT